MEFDGVKLFDRSLIFNGRATSWCAENNLKQFTGLQFAVELNWDFIFAPGCFNQG